MVVAPRGIGPLEVARRTARQLELYQAVGQGLAAGAEPQALLELILRGAVEILGLRTRRAAGSGPLRAAAAAVGQRRRRCRRAGRAAGPAPGPGRRGRGPGGAGAAALPRAHGRQPRLRGLSGADLLAAACCTGYAVAPVRSISGVVAVLYGDGGPGGLDVVAEQASELAGLATQAGLVCGQLAVAPLPA